METIIYILAGILALTAIVFVAWQLASRRYSLPCPVWLRWMVELDNPFTQTNRAAVIIALLDPQPGMTVLDGGCGPGRLTLPLAQRVGDSGQVVAVDIQAGMLARVREKAKAAGIENIELVEAGIGQGKLGLKRFDRAVLVTVLGEIPDRQAALKEIFGAMKPGGLLAVTEVIFDPHFQRRSVVARLAAEAGFHQRETHGNCIAYTMILQRPDPKS
jgi:ubiquinone/menaquinone biosynthesis C-methylase UbiE